jgi:hypothetical protein
MTRMTSPCARWGRCSIFGHERQACAVDGHLHDGILIVKDQGATDCQGNRLVSVIEFPTVDALPASGS